MTTNTRSPHEIERDIERDRAELTDNLETLQDRFSVDGVMTSLGDQLREHGGDISASISRTVKENPAAIALTGIGLAWMIIGGRSKTDDRYESDFSSSRSRSYGRREEYDRYGDREAHRSMSRPDPRFKGGHAGLPSWAHVDDDDDDDGFADRV